MSQQEHDDSEELELLDPQVESELGEALRAAWAPSELDPALNCQLIQAALEDPLSPPSEEEIAESQRLRAALEGRGEHPDADLAQALRTASAPHELGRRQGEKLARQAADSARRSNVIYVAFGTAAAALAVAAALALVLSPLGREPTASRPALPARPAANVAISRSTAPLFDEKFRAGNTTARIDRIALARARDLRQNRYASWGVR